MAKRTIRRRHFLAGAGAAVVGAAATVKPAQGEGARAPAAPATPAADVVLRNGKVITIDARVDGHRGDRRFERQDHRGRPERRDGAAYRSRHARRRPQGQGGHSRHHRRPCAYGPGRAAQRVSVARARALDPRHPGPDRRARARQEAGRVDRHHADRRSAVLLSTSPTSSPKSAGRRGRSSIRRRRTTRSISARSGGSGAERSRSCPAPTPRRSSAPASRATPRRR